MSGKQYRLYRRVHDTTEVSYRFYSLQNHCVYEDIHPIMLHGVQILQNVKYFEKQKSGDGGGGTTRPLPRDGCAEELRGDEQSGHTPRSGS